MRAQSLVSLYADRHRAVLDGRGDADLVAAVTQAAVQAVPGVEQASISEARQGRFRTRASTGDMALRGDLIQYELTSGPCVQAITTDSVYETGDVSVDGRWPTFGTRVHAETGARSMLSLPLFTDGGDRRAGLNLYSTRRDAFSAAARSIATIVATLTAGTLIALDARDHAEQLERALVNSRSIGMAMGVLMSSRRITEDAAFALLRTASQHSNRKLADIARDVVTTGTLDLPTPAR